MTARTVSIPEFRVYAGSAVADVVEGDRAAVVNAVESAYRAHAAARTVNPDSYFLRFPQRPADRIIALPAHYTTDDGDAVTGIKWISSFPANVEQGLARASAVLILNDDVTGYPIACMEAGLISATRTAASAVSALRLLAAGEPVRSVAVIGTGVISRRVVDFLAAAGIEPEQIVLFDQQPEYADRFSESIRATGTVPVVRAASLESAVTGSDVVLFATTAGSPHVVNPELFAHNPIVLHLSLRDLGPDVVLSAHNVVDDVDHALKAQTSLHLAEQAVGNRDFVAHTLPGILTGDPVPDRTRPIIFSPFGMGILDLAVAHLVHSALVGSAEPVKDFFHGAERF